LLENELFCTALAREVELDVVEAHVAAPNVRVFCAERFQTRQLVTLNAGSCRPMPGLSDGMSGYDDILSVQMSWFVVLPVEVTAHGAALGDFSVFALLRNEAG
jgi:hypothetical protein